MEAFFLKSSPLVTVERFDSFDAFSPNGVIGGGVSVPLQPRLFSASRATLPLPDSLLVLQRSFPRKLETDLGVAKGVGLFVPLSFDATINGVTFDNSMIGIMRDKTSSRVLEERPNVYLMLRFNSAMHDRGWAVSERGVAISRASEDAMDRLRTMIVHVFGFASAYLDGRQIDAVSHSLQETLVAGLDQVLVQDDFRSTRSGSYEQYKRYVAQIDEIVGYTPHAALYSQKLATEIGVSARTLQSATRAVHGVSLHHYLRAKRLWSVSKLLVSGNPSLTVKAAALANGFWHMGEFSQSYKFAYGEVPSETLARARRA